MTDTGERYWICLMEIRSRPIEDNGDYRRSVVDEMLAAHLVMTDEDRAEFRRRYNVVLKWDATQSEKAEVNQ